MTRKAPTQAHAETVWTKRVKVEGLKTAARTSLSWKRCRLPAPSVTSV